MKDKYKQKVKKAFLKAFSDDGGRIILTEKMPNNKKQDWEIEAHVYTIWEWFEKCI